jgi:predicted Zn-dependent protease with MMP-like domain
MELDEMEGLLEEILQDFPQELFQLLNGGILLLPEEKRNPDPKLDQLYILGEYHSGGPMGRFITLYYGSFCAVYPQATRKRMRKELERTLKHEFLHHVEGLAGERSLEMEDRQRIQDYLERKG